MTNTLPNGDAIPVIPTKEDRKLIIEKFTQFIDSLPYSEFTALMGEVAEEHEEMLRPLIDTLIVKLPKQSNPETVTINRQEFLTTFTAGRKAKAFYSWKISDMIQELQEKVEALDEAFLTEGDSISLYNDLIHQVLPFEEVESALPEELYDAWQEEYEASKSEVSQ